MCETDKSRPPLPPVSGGTAVDAGDFHLTASDGNRFLAYFARAAEPTGVGVVIIPSRLGLGAFYKELTERFAELGIDSVAFDYYGRTAGVDPRDETFDFSTHYDQATRPEARPGTNADVAAAVEWLRSPEGGAVESVFTLGFCFGGSISWWHSAADPTLAGCIGFYGAPRYLLDSIPEMEVPLLLLVAGDDSFIPPEEMEDFERRLRETGVPFESKVYPEAPHSFFDRRFAEYGEASDDAWRRVLAFVERNRERAVSPLR